MACSELCCMGKGEGNVYSNGAQGNVGIARKKMSKEKQKMTFILQIFSTHLYTLLWQE